MRIGFTTGSSATAAAKAGVLFLVRGVRPKRVDIPCPEGHVRLVVRLESLEVEASPADERMVRVTVRKQAGDDPDATHDAAISARVHLEPWPRPEVVVRGGKGVGTVTRPGLPVPVGRAAINPGPLRQIRRALLETLEQLGCVVRVHVLVEVPRGEELATRTLNPRLGIVGGISILGTRGTVKAFSHAAWKETIIQCLDVARAEGLDTVALSTGGRGQRFLETVLPRLPRAAFIQAGDHPGFAMRQAARRGMRKVIWGGFWGKLVKMAQGRPQTHARLFAVNLPGLADLAADSGVERDAIEKIVRANTAREALDILRGTDRFAVATWEVLVRALGHCRVWSRPKGSLGGSLWGRASVDVELILLDYDGQVLHRTEHKASISTESHPTSA
ncbi:cobalt-precorrin-5B (C(1))-methyltransferase CbiD [Desulfonatronum sp. SC1]|uniref:cobalt-precorrin-5B (C(1))-methyltransferase CbiD n=1 Tax=Desulfonatronum sp. SC1 TaxID=2109626 RepID=UPI001304DDD2|nr:cobalt-precorrin-5B (C(1))-methyltransferase CbiD [Desulfonatronum sp. SC1]